MRTINTFILTGLLLFSSLALAKPSPKNNSANKSAAVDVSDQLQNVIVYEGATKVPVVAKQAILIDYNTNKVLLEKNADEQMVPSSMSKMMTSYLISDRLMKGELKPDTLFQVSEKAWRIQGSKTFVPLHASVRVMDLLRGIIIQSGNDACIVAAEGISGSEEQFVFEMNEKAKAIGMKATQFKNASGWPEEGHYSTARDLAILSRAVVKDHPDFYGIHQEKDFTFNGIKQGNRNPLLYGSMGCDGIKTGHTDEAGYGVSVSCVDGNQRYILVINGLNSMQQRADEARKLINWAKTNFVNKTVIKKGQVVNAAVPLTMGKAKTVPAIANQDVNMLVLRSEQNKLQTQFVFEENLQAPLAKGDPIGKIIVSSPNNKVEAAAVAGEDCEKIGFVGRMLRFIGMDV